MITISKPLGAAQLRTYHAEEFSNARENYYTTDQPIAHQVLAHEKKRYRKRGQHVREQRPG